MKKYMVIKNFMPKNFGIKKSIADLSDEFHDSKVGDGVNENLNLACQEFNIPMNKIFVATNNQKKARQSALKLCTFFQYSGNQEYNTFIEQCICSESEAFVMSRFNDYSKSHDKYTRSSWSSFVKDHRLYLKKKPANSNLVLFDRLHVTKAINPERSGR